MKLNVRRVTVWAAMVKDSPGALAEKLAALTGAGANLGFVVARRDHKNRGAGVVFVTPITGAAQIRAARKLGFTKADSLHSVRVDGADRRGLGAKLTGILGDAGINLRGLSAGVVGKRFVLHLAFDRAPDAAKAIRLLKRVS